MVLYTLVLFYIYHLFLIFFWCFLMFIVTYTLPLLIQFLISLSFSWAGSAFTGQKGGLKFLHFISL